MMELSQRERSFILEYRQATPQEQELVQKRLRAAAAKAERERTGKNRSVNDLVQV